MFNKLEVSFFDLERIINYISIDWNHESYHPAQYNLSPSK